MKLKLTLTISSLLFIGMLLINFVLLFLWKHDALQSKAEHDQAVLAHIQSLLGREKETAKGAVVQEFVFSDFYPSSENGRFFVLLEAEKQAGQGKEKRSRQTEMTRYQRFLPLLLLKPGAPVRQ